MNNLWKKLFLVERPSLSLSMFRIAVALTTGFHVVPTLVHLRDNYFPTAFKTYNTNFFTLEFIQQVQKSPDELIIFFVILFCLTCFTFLIGLFSQISCILMTACCYYFYALNSFHVGTLSWDILLVTLFLMCVVPYHGDYFSVDCLLKGDEQAFKKRRPYFLQRMLQLQIGFTYFYTALYKMYPEGNWLHENPMFNIMNYPPAGTTKTFLIRDFLINQPALCYALGISCIVIEISMLFLLFMKKTRVSAIILGFIFHITLVLTLDVPAIFFFLFPPQLLLFINSECIVSWIDQKRANSAPIKKNRLIYDGKCQFCLRSVQKLRIGDIFGLVDYVDLHQIDQFKGFHHDLTREKALSQLCLIDASGNLSLGFHAIRKLCLNMPLFYALLPILYFPGMGIVGPIVYKIIARNRYLLHFSKKCHDNTCFRL